MVEFQRMSHMQCGIFVYEHSIRKVHRNSQYQWVEREAERIMNSDKQRTNERTREETRVERSET